MTQAKHSKKSADSLGGHATVRKYGSQHMARIGRKGAAVTWKRYRLAPVGTSDLAMVHKRTGEIRAFLSGRMREVQ